MNKGQTPRGRAAPTPRRWGRVWARPSEYMIKLRGGKVVRHGPGLSMFIWPWETYAVLPTTIQEISFVADQVTAEKVGVEVTGMAVYRIAEPVIAFGMLDCAGHVGVDVLAHTLREMATGAARRLVANLTVEQCLTRRKEGIAQELVREIQPVVSGSGRVDDGTDQGWGVVIDTIEIQDVRVLSEQVFDNMQAPYRAQLELTARRSMVQRDEELHLREVEAAHRKLEVDQELGRQQAEAEQGQRLQQVAQRERLELTEVESGERVERARLQRDLASCERQQERAQAESQVDQQQAELARLALQARLAHQALEAEAQLGADKQQLELRQLEGELKARLRGLLDEVDNRVTDQRTRHELVTTALPAVARALAKGMGPVQLTQISSERGGGPGVLAEAVAQVLALVQGAGLDLSQWQAKTPPTP